MNNYKSKKSFVISSVLIFLASLLVLSGAASFAAEKEITAIAVGCIPHEEIQLTAKKFKPVLLTLEEVTGKKVEWFFPTSYASLIEAHRRGFVHIAYYGPRSYIDAHRVSDGKIDAFCWAIWGLGPYKREEPGYRSLLIVKPDSPYQRVEDLKGKTVALGKPGSTSTEMLPKVRIGQEVGMKIDKFFGKIFFGGTHISTAYAVKEGRADAGFVADVALDWGVDGKQIGPKDFRVIWSSKRIPVDPFAWRKDLLPFDLKELVMKAFLRLNESDYGKEFLKSMRAYRIEKTDDKAYDELREVYAEFGKWE